MSNNTHVNDQVGPLVMWCCLDVLIIVKLTAWRAANANEKEGKESEEAVVQEHVWMY